MEFIDLKRQYTDLKESIDGRINAVLKHGQFIMGPEVTELEDMLARYTGAKHAIACSSGTDALLIALMALNVGAGDEVITTPFTFIATAEVIALLGARPVFVDIDPETYNMDPNLVEAAITPKTKAIMAVSLYGQCADFDRINESAARHKIPVVEDGAQSFGAMYKGRLSCNLSNIGCTSFFPSKPLGCYGDGGMCFTSDDVLAARMKQIRLHGQDRRYHHSILGVNGRLDTLQAAVLLAKMEAFDAEINERIRIGSTYTQLLKPFVHTPFVESHSSCVYAQYTIEVNDRSAFQGELKSRGIPTAVHYPVPLHLQPAFAFLGEGEGDFPMAEAAARRVVSLPMHPYLTSDEQERVADAVTHALSKAQPSIVGG